MTRQALNIGSRAGLPMTRRIGRKSWHNGEIAEPGGSGKTGDMTPSWSQLSGGCVKHAMFSQIRQAHPRVALIVRLGLLTPRSPARLGMKLGGSLLPHRWLTTSGGHPLPRECRDGWGVAS